jgi:hypothetical protein
MDLLYGAIEGSAAVDGRAGFLPAAAEDVDRAVERNEEACRV